MTEEPPQLDLDAIRGWLVAEMPSMYADAQARIEALLAEVDSVRAEWAHWEGRARHLSGQLEQVEHNCEIVAGGLRSIRVELSTCKQQLRATRGALQQIFDIDWVIGDSATEAMNEAQLIAQRALDQTTQETP